MSITSESVCLMWIVDAAITESSSSRSLDPCEIYSLNGGLSRRWAIEINWLPNDSANTLLPHNTA